MTVNSYVYIDWDYVLGGTIDFTTPGDDITSYRQSVDIRVGGQPMQRMARVGSCNITLDNESRYFSPRYNSSPYHNKLLPMKPVKVVATDGVDSWTVFTGWTRKIAPQANRWKERRVKIECFDWLGMIQASDIDIPLRENVVSSQLIKDVLNYAVKAPIAESVYSVTAVPANNDTITVNGTAYRLRTTMAQANDIQIGAATGTGRYDTINAMVAAINGWDGETTAYYLGTTQPSNVRARFNDSYYQIIQEDAPVRRHRCGETSGVIAYDLGSNGANGTIVGSPTLNVTGAITNDTDGAIRLDGVDDYISEPPLDFENRSFSVEVWFKPAASPPANQDLFNAFHAFVNKECFFIRLTSAGVLSAQFFGGTAASKSGIGTGSWLHIVATYDYSSSTLVLYVNGVAESTVTSTGPFTGAVTSMQFGTFLVPATFCKGDMDEAAIWLRVISAEEVAAHYAAKTSAPSPGFTLYSLLRGAIGNTYTSAESSTAITVSGANLSGGADTPIMTTSIETGLRTFPYAGDDWEGDRGVDAYKALQSVCESERGRFYVKRDGTAVYENYAKEFSLYQATAVLQLYQDLSPTTAPVVIDMDSELSIDDVINSVTVRYTPRSTTSTGVAAKITTPIKAPGRWGKQDSNPNANKQWYANGNPVGDPGQLVVNLPYTDPDTGRRIGAKNLTSPVISTDWTANELEDGTGTDYTTYVPQQLFFTIAPKASGVDIHIKNTALGNLYIRKLQVRGTLIKRDDAQVIVKEDIDSIALYGRKNRQISLPMESDSNFAEAIAGYELSRMTDPLWRPKRVSWRNVQVDQLGNKVLAAELGDAMMVYEFQNMSSLQQVRTRIVGITYTFGLQNEFSTTFDVEVLDDQNYGIYGRSLANYDTALWTI